VSYPLHTAAFLKEARDVFGMTNWQFVDGNKSTRVLEVVGAESLDGKIGTAPGQNPAIPGFENFAEAFRSRFGHQRIPPFTAAAYDAAIIVGFAVAKAIVDGESKLTGRVVRDRLRQVANPPGAVIVGGNTESVRAGLQQIKEGQAVDYSGATGSTDFDSRGDVITPIEVWRFAGGAIETVQFRSANDIPVE
jgi:branched-chain amino acid transport system substrate-binding protein